MAITKNVKIFKVITVTTALFGALGMIIFVWLLPPSEPPPDLCRDQPRNFGTCVQRQFALPLPAAVLVMQLQHYGFKISQTTAATNGTRAGMAVFSQHDIVCVKTWSVIWDVDRNGLATNIFGQDNATCL